MKPTGMGPKGFESTSPFTRVPFKVPTFGPTPIWGGEGLCGGPGRRGGGGILTEDWGKCDSRWGGDSNAIQDAPYSISLPIRTRIIRRSRPSQTSGKIARAGPGPH